LLLLALGWAVLYFQDDGVRRLAVSLSLLPLHPGAQWIEPALEALIATGPRRLELLGAAMLVYGSVFTTEGTGLLLHQYWAEWLTALVTASFLPLEAYELIARVRWTRLVLLLANVGIVVYLVACLRDRSRA